MDCDATMVYIASWQEYQEAAENLYVKSPNKVSSSIDDTLLHYITSPQTRYCVKWKSSEGKLVLKITDDTTVCGHSNRRIINSVHVIHIQCIKFKTYSSIFLNRFESLNLSLMQKMQNRRPDPPPSTTLPQSSAGGDSSHPRTASPMPVPQTGLAAGGVKKKKPKKRK